MAVLLDTPNESLLNTVNLVDDGPIVLASSSNNIVTNTSTMQATGANQAAIEFATTSANATVSNIGEVRGGFSALYFKGDGATIGNAGEMIGGYAGVIVSASTETAVTLSNISGGMIEGGTVGIQFDAGATSEIKNGGTVHGSAGVLLLGGKLINSGEIEGNSVGISCDGTTTILNTDAGIILSTGTAITVASREVSITNDVDCTITGSQAAIRTGDGILGSSSRIALANLGKIDGLIDCNAKLGITTDIIVNKGTITGNVYLGDDDDIFNGAGGTSGKVYGEAGNDTLIGGSASDYISGGAGMDTIRGSRGKDALFGGADRDIFDFNSIKESLKGSARDVIQDFKRGTDDIDLRGVDAKKGVSGNNAFKFIGKHDFHDKKGELRYEDKGAKVIVQGDVNGDGKADFEILVKVGALSSGDFLL